MGRHRDPLLPRLRRMARGHVRSAASRKRRRTDNFMEDREIDSSDGGGSDDDGGPGVPTASLSEGEG